jgi:hypothetical protein
MSLMDWCRVLVGKLVQWKRSVPKSRPASSTEVESSNVVAQLELDYAQLLATFGPLVHPRHLSRAARQARADHRLRVPGRERRRNFIQRRHPRAASERARWGSSPGTRVRASSTISSARSRPTSPCRWTTLPTRRRRSRATGTTTCER